MLLLCHAATRPARPCAAVWTTGEPRIVSAHSPDSQSLPLRWASMTDNSTNKGGTDAGSESGLVALDSPDEEAAFPEELIEIDDDGSDEDDAPGTGAVSGGFGFAGLALAIVSLTTNWTSSVVVSHAQFNEEAHAPSSGLTAQQDLNLYANGWRTQ